jgi:hypothetical protein
MKRIIVYAILLGLAACGVGFVMNFTESELKESDNLILNYGFEKGDYEYNNLPEDWIVLEQSDKNVFWDDNVSLNGSKSLKFENSSSKLTLISDAFPLNPETVYYATCYLKSQMLSSKNVVLYFHAFDENGKKVNQFSRKLSPDTNWRRLALSIGFLKSSAKFGRITIMFPNDTNNIYWIDDVKCFAVHSFQKRK